MKELLPMMALFLTLCGLNAGEARVMFRVPQATDVDGRVHDLGGQEGVKATVFVFLGPECPISQRYVPELNRIAAQEGTNAVRFYGVISSPSIARTQAVAFVHEYAIRFPVLFDHSGHLARWLRPTHVPEAFVLNQAGPTVYHGRVDDGYESPGRPRAVIRNRELRDAIRAALAGKAPKTSFVRPVGCYFEEWPTAAVPNR